MFPSFLFWFDTLLSLVIGFTSLTLFFLVLSVGLRRRLNQTFSLFTVSAALVGLASAIANVSLWFNSRVLTDNARLGDPHFLIELAATGFYFAGPTLLAFAITFVETTTSSAELPKAHQWYKRLSTLGFLIGLGLLPVVFGHYIISDFFLDPLDMSRWQITGWGYAISASPFLFEALALILFWQNRQHLGGPALAISTAILVGGGAFGALVQIPFPIISFSFAIGILTTGRAVTSRQIFNPLRTLTQQLESKVAERTAEMQQARQKLEHLNEKQHQVAQISREIARSATPADVLTRLVELIHGRLGYHHVYAYQPDETGQYLFLRAAAGTNAPRLLAEGQRLHIGRSSIVGQAAVERQARRAQAQGENIAYFDNTALPGARAEMALPLLVGDRLLGVIDLQSIHLEAFSNEDLVILTTLADQVAVTLDNLRLLQETGSALSELEKVQRQYLRQAWRSTVGKLEDAPAYVYTDSGGVTATNLNAARSPEIAQALSEGQAQINATDEDQTGSSSTVALPITLRGQVIGALQLRQKAGQAWEPEDLDTLSQVTERLGLALETARLSQETQRHADRERLIREITDRMQRATDMETLFQIAAEELNKALSASRAYVRLGTEAGFGVSFKPTEPRPAERNTSAKGMSYETT
jgi:GAF domain-containing protein